MSIAVLVVDDEPDVEALFRQQFRRDLRAQRFVMDFAASASEALPRVSDAAEQPPLILILSDINMPGMTGLEMLPKMKESGRSSRHHDYRLRRPRPGVRPWKEAQRAY